MKKYILTFIALATLWSCQTDEQYEDLNRDPKNPTEVSADFLFTSSTVNLADQMASPNVNVNIFRFVAQYLTATTYLDEPNYDLNNRAISDNHWSILYRNVIFNLVDAKQYVQNNENLDDSEKATRIAQIEVLEVYAWQVLVDTFGDIPYSEALDGGDNTLPAYDDAATIYEDLISRLNAASSDLAAGGEGFSSADVLYGGNIGNWEKFANSLKLRLAMHLADVNPSLSQTAAEEAYNDGVFESNEESATLDYQASPPNTNPLWEDLVQSGRQDYVAANTIIDYMEGLDDPRLPFYFDQNLGPDEYLGGIYGASNSFSSHTHINGQFREPTHPGILMDYAEVEFHLTDAAQRGYAVGDAEDHYEAAVTASITYFGGTEEEADEYLSSEAAYDGSQEQLATQFWLAMFDNPFEGWNVWRKFDGPELNLAAQSERPVPLRFTYPIDEQNLNEANWEAASSAIGGDDQQTPLFWDTTVPETPEAPAEEEE